MKPSTIQRCSYGLLVLGLLQMVGDLSGWKTLKGLAAATAASPAPKVFSSVRGLETYSTRFYLEWDNDAGAQESIEVTSEIYARLKGPYNRRNVIGAALAYGPVLSLDAHGSAMLKAVLNYHLNGDAPLLSELGLQVPQEQALRLRYEPVQAADPSLDSAMDPSSSQTFGPEKLPRVIEIPAPTPAPGKGTTNSNSQGQTQAEESLEAE